MGTVWPEPLWKLVFEADFDCSLEFVAEFIAELVPH